MRQRKTLVLAVAMACGQVASAAVLTNDSDLVVAEWGLGATGDNNQITNNATITATNTPGSPSVTDNAHALYSYGDNNQLINNGTLEAFSANGGAFGVDVRGDSNQIQNQETVTTSSSAINRGIYIDGDLNTLSNTAAISSSSGAAQAIAVEGNQNTLNLSGSMEAQGATGIRTLDVTGDNNQISSSGAVVADGGINVAGIAVTGNSNNVTQGATTEVGSGDGATGFLVTGNDNRVILRDRTEVTATLNAAGLDVDGNRNQLTVNADLVVQANSELSQGANVNGLDNTFSNSAAMTVSGEESAGVVSIGDDLAFTNTGSIAVTGSTEATGVSADGNNASLSTAGTFNVEGVQSAQGMILLGDDSSFQNSGTITAESVQSAVGIGVTGSNTSVQNSGAVTVSATGSGVVVSNISGVGMSVSGDENTLENTGQVSVTGVSSASGLTSSGNRNVVSNDATVTIQSNALAIAFESSGDDTAITNQGAVDVDSEGQAKGIVVSGQNNTVENRGSLSVSGNTFAAGVEGIGDDNIFNNRQALTATSFNSAFGVNINGSDNTLNNTDTITVLGNNAARGMAVAGDNNILANYNMVSVSSNLLAEGIRVDGANNNITNTGTLTVEGAASAVGIVSKGDQVSVTNNGSIIAVANESYGIQIEGEGASISNTGSITANTKAIEVSGANATVNLFPGSDVRGTIDLGESGDNDVVNWFASKGDVPTRLALENVESAYLYNVPGIVTPDSILTVDITTEGSRGRVLSESIGGLHQLIHQRVSSSVQNRRTRFNRHPSGVNAGDSYSLTHWTHDQPVLWVQGFGGKSEFDGDGVYRSYDTKHLGLAVGLEGQLYDSRVGLVGGLVDASTDGDDGTFRSDDQLFYFGGYQHRNLSEFNYTLGVMGGYGLYENKHQVFDSIDGMQTAKSDTDGFFLSPSVSVDTRYNLINSYWYFRPAASLSYTKAWYDGYRESGTSNANLSVDDRSVSAWKARLQVAAFYPVSSSFDASLRFGLLANRFYSDNVSGQLSGADFSFDASGNHDNSGHFWGFTLRSNLSSHYDLLFDLEYGSLTDENYLNGRLQAMYRF